MSHKYIGAMSAVTSSETTHYSECYSLQRTRKQCKTTVHYSCQILLITVNAGKCTFFTDYSERY